MDMAAALRDQHYLAAAIVRKFIRKRRLKALRQRTLAAQQQLDFDHTKYTELAKSVSCEPFSESERDQLVHSWSICQSSTSILSMRRSAYSKLLATRMHVPFRERRERNNVSAH